MKRKPHFCNLIGICADEQAYNQPDFANADALSRNAYTPMLVILIILLVVLNRQHFGTSITIAYSTHFVKPSGLIAKAKFQSFAQYSQNINTTIYHHHKIKITARTLLLTVLLYSCMLFT
jgi:hypothetical protein